VSQESQPNADDRWLASRHTTPEVVANFADLKVLGKGDFKALMKWRLAIRLEIGLDVKTVPEVETTEDVTIAPMDEEEEISEEVRCTWKVCANDSSKDYMNRNSPRHVGSENGTTRRKLGHYSDCNLT